MNEIIKVKNSSYAKYEEMLMRRDALKKETFQLRRAYTAEFGDLILAVFEQKIACIKNKKTIEYIQASLNHGQLVDQDELKAYLAQEMASYQEQLDNMVEDYHNARRGEIVSEYDMLIIKRIYHKLVKLIHPDINPVVSDNDILMNLWNRVSIAYHCNDRKGMEELELLVGSALEQLGMGELEIEIPDIEEKIAEIEAEMECIRSKDPYMYKYILEDSAAVEEKKQSLRKELKEYEDYAAKLEQRIAELMTKGVSFLWRMN